MGLRTNGSEREGDIDLLVRNSSFKKETLVRLCMIAKFELVLGDWEIDMVGDYEGHAVVQETILTGVCLYDRKKELAEHLLQEFEIYYMHISRIERALTGLKSV